MTSSPKNFVDNVACGSAHEHQGGESFSKSKSLSNQSELDSCPHYKDALKSRVFWSTKFKLGKVVSRFASSKAKLQYFDDGYSCNDYVEVILIFHVFMVLLLMYSSTSSSFYFFCFSVLISKFIELARIGQLQLQSCQAASDIRRVENYTWCWRVPH